ncbi:MAG: glycosyltransferase family 4 protein [Candidatus Krumholzibacteria bacterium]|nr:glycosyltransferase family 4 protein [Candidatus Krumholzibacteria bacterium]
MRIGMVLQAGIPPNDIRVEKEAKTLLAAGHEVHLLLEGEPGRPREEVWEGIRLVRGVRMSRLREIAHRYTFNFTFRDPLWSGALERFVEERGIEALHVHDLPLAAETLRAGRRAGIPVVADLHENFPAGLQVWYSSRLQRMTIYNEGRWTRYEREALREVDAVIAVIDESKERLAGIGISREKIFVVPNTESRHWEQAPVDPTVLERYRGGFTLSYVGKFSAHRGLDVIVRAMPRLKREIPGVKLLLVGDRNRPYLEYLRRLVETTGVGDAVELTGWQPFGRIWSYIEASDVCIVPHQRNPHTDTTIPHKIFQYMLLGKPVIVSDCPPLERVIGDAGAGLVFRHDDPDDFAARVIELRADPALRGRIAAAGREAFLDRWNWEATSGPLVRLYEDLAAGRRPDAGRAGRGGVA